MAHSNTPPHVYVKMWEDLLNRPNVYTKKGVKFILAVVLLLPPAPCPGDAVFSCEVLGLGFQKRTQLEINGSVVFTTPFQNSSTQILECVQRNLQRTIS